MKKPPSNSVDNKLRQTTLFEFMPEEVRMKIIQSENTAITDKDDNRYRHARVPSQWCCCGHLSEDHNYFGCVVFENLVQCPCNSFVSDDALDGEEMYR
jgi:hypothetical protein